MAWASTAESEWTEFHYTHAIGAVVAGLDPEFVNPDDLRGKFLARRGYGGAAGGGLRLEANAGPAREGDEFQVDVDYRYPLRRIFADVSKSSTAPYRMEGDDPATPATAAAIALALNPDNPGAEEEELSPCSIQQFQDFLAGPSYSARCADDVPSGGARNCGNGVTTSCQYTCGGASCSPPACPKAGGIGGFLPLDPFGGAY